MRSSFGARQDAPAGKIDVTTGKIAQHDLPA